MKKVFIEPEMQKIELNLRENIAVSSQVNMGYYFTVSLFSCHIVSTGKYVGQVSEDEASVCLVTGNARSIMRFYARDEVLPHFKR